jgi:hypothetical protein
LRAQLVFFSGKCGSLGVMARPSFPTISHDDLNHDDLDRLFGRWFAATGAEMHWLSAVRCTVT